MGPWRKPTPLVQTATTLSDYLILSAALLAAAGGFLFLFLWAAGIVEAETCPNPGEQCKVITLTPQEEQMLVKQGGVLDSAAAGRYLDLANVVTYFRVKLMQAPAGEVKPAPAAVPAPAPPAPAQGETAK
jgi:hypothetical protein